MLFVLDENVTVQYVCVLFKTIIVIELLERRFLFPGMFSMISYRRSKCMRVQHNKTYTYKRQNSYFDY